MVMLRQVSRPCTCGSYYRVDDKCNKCGKVDSVKEEHEVFTGLVTAAGPQWSKKKHRYLTTKEIAAGERGG
jgi:hypothetical protein